MVKSPPQFSYISKWKRCARDTGPTLSCDLRRRKSAISRRRPLSPLTWTISPSVAAVSQMFRLSSLVPLAGRLFTRQRSPPSLRLSVPHAPNNIIEIDMSENPRRTLSYRNAIRGRPIPVTSRS